MCKKKGKHIIQKPEIKSVNETTAKQFICFCYITKDQGQYIAGNPKT
jgi:hypothetical protein